MSISEASQSFQSVIDGISESIIIDEEVLGLIFAGFLARGHVLLEDVPGTGKTLTAKSLASALGLSFNRIQFTPDLLPSDVTGTEIYNEHTGDFEFKRGPIFANFVLADEINRASPKTQSALLESMEERQVTVSGETYELPSPFFVIATQNPVERGDGTFPLPEAQKDRFLIKSSLGFPTAEGELKLLHRRDQRQSRSPSVDQVLTPASVRTLQRTVESVQVDADVKQYIVDIVRATRADGRVRVGVSPRGSQRVFELSRAWALRAERRFVTPDDVKAVSHASLTHRIALTSDARVNNVTKSQVISDVLDDAPVPTVTRAGPTSERAIQ